MDFHQIHNKWLNLMCICNKRDAFTRELHLFFLCQCKKMQCLLEGSLIVENTVRTFHVLDSCYYDRTYISCFTFQFNGLCVLGFAKAVLFLEIPISKLSYIYLYCFNFEVLFQEKKNIRFSVATRNISTGWYYFICVQAGILDIITWL